MNRRTAREVMAAGAMAGFLLALAGPGHAQLAGPYASPQTPPGHQTPLWSSQAYPGGSGVDSRGLLPVDAGVPGPSIQYPGTPLPDDTGEGPPSGQGWPTGLPALPTDTGAPPSGAVPPDAQPTPPAPTVPGVSPPATGFDPGAPLAPGTTTGLEAAAAAPFSGLGGALSGEGRGALVMLGDSPTVLPRFNARSFAGRNVFPQQSTPPIPPPVIPPRPGLPEFGPVLPEELRTKPLVPSVRGIKIAENQSPLPMDRIYFTFNYFNDVNVDVNNRLGSVITDINVYRYILGFEKTFAEGRGSYGLQVPIDNLTSSSRIPGLKTNGTAVGNVNAIFKYALLWDPERGNVFSSGLLLGTPTGPGRFAGFENIETLNNFRIQPFVGYLYTYGNLYFHGFSSITIPTNPNDVTVWYNDNGIGYFLYQTNDLSQFITVVAPTFEVHVNTPLNHSDPFDFTDPAGTPNFVNFTYGLNVGIKSRGLFSVGYVQPVGFPRVFAGELIAMMNYRY